MPERKPKSGPSPAETYAQLTPADQRLAELLAQGMSQTEAWPASSPSRKATGASASELCGRRLKDVEFKGVVDWLRAQDAERAGWTRQMWWEGMRQLAEFDPIRGEQWAAGQLKVEDLTPAERKAFTGFSVTEAGERAGERRSCKWVSPLDVYKAVAAPLGIATDRVEMTVEEADRILREEAGVTTTEPE